MGPSRATYTREDVLALLREVEDERCPRLPAVTSRTEWPPSGTHQRPVVLLPYRSRPLQVPYLKTDPAEELPSHSESGLRKTSFRRPAPVRLPPQKSSSTTEHSMKQEGIDYEQTWQSQSNDSREHSDEETRDVSPDIDELEEFYKAHGKRKRRGKKKRAWRLVNQDSALNTAHNAEMEHLVGRKESAARSQPDTSDLQDLGGNKLGDETIGASDSGTQTHLAPERPRDAYSQDPGMDFEVRKRRKTDHWDM